MLSIPASHPAMASPWGRPVTTTRLRFGATVPIVPGQADSTLLTSPPRNVLNTVGNWWRVKANLLSHFQKVGGRSVNPFRFWRWRWHYRQPMKALVEQLDQHHWPFVATAEPLQRIGYHYEKGVPPSLVWAEPNGHGGAKRKNTNGLIARILIQTLGNPALCLPANSVTEAAAQLHELRAQLSQRSMAKALAIPGLQPRSGGGFLDTQWRHYWRQWFPELRPRCDAIREPFAHRLQGLAPGIFSLAGMRESKRPMYSMIQVHHLLFIADNGAMLITDSPSPKTMLAMIDDDARAQRAIEKRRPLLKEGWGFLPRPSGLNGLGLADTLALLKQQANGEITHRTLNDWGDAETLLREIPFDIARHMAQGRFRILMDKPGKDGRRVMDQWNTP